MIEISSQQYYCVRKDIYNSYQSQEKNEKYLLYNKTESPI